MIDLLLMAPPLMAGYKHIKKARPFDSPLGLAYIAAYIEKYGYKVKIVDADVLQLGLKDIERSIKKYSPTIVGISTTTSTITQAYEILSIVKEIDSDIMTVVGGAHASAAPESTLRQSKDLNIVVRGEGEHTMSDILHLSEDKVNISDIMGISYYKNGKIRHNPNRELIEDLDELPFPARHLLEMDKYKPAPYMGSSSTKYATMLAARGCPYNCTFCGQNIIFRRIVRRRTPSNIVDEIQHLIEMYGTELLFFLDSTFTVNRKFVIDVCSEIIKSGVDFEWAATGRVNHVDRDMYEIMKKAGCRHIYYGVESGNQQILNQIKKQTTIKQTKEAFAITRHVGISIIASFIFGLPNETIKTVYDTINFAIELNPDYATFSIATPYPGTAFYETAIKEGHTLEDWAKYTSARYSDPIYAPKGMTKDELKALHIKAFKKFYLRPKYIKKAILRTKSISDLFRNVDIALNLLKS